MAYASRHRQDPYPQDAYYGRNPPYWETGDPPAPAPAPRRSNSARQQRRGPSPDPDRGASRRHRDYDSPRDSHRKPDDRRGEREPRRDPRDQRDQRGQRDSRDVGEQRQSRHDRESAPRDSRGFRDDRYNDDPRRHRRTRTAEDPQRRREPSPNTRHKSRDYPPPDDRGRGGRGYANTRGRDTSPVHASRPRARDFVNPGQDGFDRDGRRDRDGGGHSSRSHPKDKPSRAVVAHSPPRGRTSHTKEKPSTTRPRSTHNTTGARSAGIANLGGKVRSSTMPAATAAAKWWQNPLVQAGARTALTAGAQAAMNNRKGQGDWLGSKGFKVASVALGAALMDSYAGAGKTDKRDDRGRSPDGRRDSRDRARGKSPARSKSEGRGGGMRDKILQSGMSYLMSKASGGR